jgi:hypothetical protein
MSDNLDNVNNLHNRLKDIFDEHKYKEKLLCELQARLSKLKEEHEREIEEQKDQFKSRILICKQESEQQKSRIEAFEKLIVALKKEKMIAIEQAALECQKVDNLNKVLESSYQEIEGIKLNLKNCMNEKKKSERMHSQSRKKVLVLKGYVDELNKSKGNVEGDLNKSYELQKGLNNLLSTREIENSSLIEKIKKLKEEQDSLEEKLRTQFQEELDRYVCIHNGELEKERRDLMEALKEKTQKSLTEYKEAIMVKNHEIENLSTSNAHFKKIVETLKRDLDLSEKREKRWEQKAKSITLDKDSFQINVEKQLKNKESLIQNLQGKYARKISEFSILEKKQKHLKAKLNVYHKFISNEEKIFEYSKRKSSGGLSPCIKRRRLHPPKLEDVNQNILKIECSNMSRSEFYLTSLVETCTSLSGWYLVINNQIKTLELQDFSIEGKQRILVSMNMNKKVETSKIIFWDVELSRVDKKDSIKLVDPNGITQSKIEFHRESSKKTSDFCMIM